MIYFGSFRLVLIGILEERELNFDVFYRDGVICRRFYSCLEERERKFIVFVGR